MVGEREREKRCYERIIVDRYFLAKGENSVEKENAWNQTVCFSFFVHAQIMK